MATSEKNKVTVSNFITAILVLFAAGTAWGVSNSRIDENVAGIDSLRTDFTVSEGNVEERLLKIQEDINKLNVALAEIGNDVKWIKENQGN